MPSGSHGWLRWNRGHWVQCSNYKGYSRYHFPGSSSFRGMRIFPWPPAPNFWRSTRALDTSYSVWSRWNLAVSTWSRLKWAGGDFWAVPCTPGGPWGDPCQPVMHMWRCALNIPCCPSCFWEGRYRPFRFCRCRTIIKSSFWSRFAPSIKIIIVSNKTYWNNR